MNIQNLFFTAKRERGRNRNNPSQFFPCHQPLFTSLNIQNYVFLAEENYLEFNFSFLFYARETKKEMKIIFTTSSLPTASIHIPLEDHAFICQRSVGFSTQQPDPSHRQHLPLRVCVSTSYLEITRGCSSVRTMSALKYQQKGRCSHNNYYKDTQNRCLSKINHTTGLKQNIICSHKLTFLMFHLSSQELREQFSD